MRVALTGGIATGKSVVARELQTAGVPTIDADQLAREVGAALAVPAWRPWWRDSARASSRPDGGLDRAGLARIVFADAAARRDLERLLHPLVRQGIEAFFAALPPGVTGVAEVPLLYETGWVRSFDVAVVTACRAATQRARLAARDGLSAADADQRLAAQWPIEDKARLADAVVMTDGSMSDTRAQARRLAALDQRSVASFVTGPMRSSTKLFHS